jgi:starch-binding outer membrane protein, SusD/RagB family
MKKIQILFFISIAVAAIAGCRKGDWLERQPKNILVDDQMWNDPKQIVGVLANLYDRIPSDMSLIDPDHTAIDINQSRQAQWRNMADYDDAMWSGAGEDGRNNLINYAPDRWRVWNYSVIRDINLSLEKIEQLGTNLEAPVRTQFLAEFRFIRALNYFEMVKRMGGVPLVTKQLIYDYSGDPSPLQTPRAKEAEVYEFIASEMDAIKNLLGNVASTTRANKYTALALKSRAMLYAASLAKYNNLMASPITTPGGEVGIPAAKANEYYQKSLDASKEIITSGAYSLYKGNPGNLGENFYEAVTKKTNNKEVIFAWDFLSAKNKRHFFTYDNIARGIREDNLSSSNITPSLNLVESYDNINGTSNELKIQLPDKSDFIYYNTVSEIFAGRDARLYGTVIYPGAPFKGLTVDMQAGIMVWNSTTNSYNVIEGNVLGAAWAAPTYPTGDGKLLTSASGPHRTILEVSNTGFYLRKYVDPAAGASTRGIQSDMWWVWFRMGEIYLNAAEAAFELGQTADAVTYINAVRERAGFGPNNYTAATLTINKIRAEFRTELAFEDHRVWDLKRWRIADQVWNGTLTSPDAMVYALYPYRIVRPGDAARDGKYVFVKMVAPRIRAPRFFQIFNYYSSIDQSVLNNNPKITRNPFQ